MDRHQSNGVVPDELSGYNFPINRLRRTIKDSSKTPLVLVACGSFSPPTLLHLRLFEIVNDFIKYNVKSLDLEVVGGYLSPVSSAYKKAGLANANHRVAMCELATKDASTWLETDSWEARQSKYQPTAKVLEHFSRELNPLEIRTGSGKKKIEIALLAGADLIQSMSSPGVWSPEDLDFILGRYKTFVVSRQGTDSEEAIQQLQQWKSNIYLVPQLVVNDVSSTKVRLFIKRAMSVEYLTPAPVIRYIKEHKLFDYETDDESQESKTPSEEIRDRGEELVAS